MVGSDAWRRAELILVEPQPQQYADAIRRLLDQGCRSFLVRPNDPVLAARLRSQFGARLRLLEEVNKTVPHDAVVIPPMGGARLDRELFTHLDEPGRIIGPITERHSTRRSLFVLSIPKAGTHLLYHLLDAFGLTAGLHFEKELAPNKYYFLVHDHSHLFASEFVERLSAQPRGGAGHPFFSTPALFIYRNPMDVLVSEVFYYVKSDKTALAHFYQDMPPDELCMRLLRGDSLIPPLRERILGRAPWALLRSVIPLCYEELVGPRGGGTLEAQARAIWSVQLKLQIPGSPTAHGERAYAVDSATFRKGRINGHKEFFRAEHYRELRRLPQDFMESLGYAMDDDFGDGYLPRFVDAFRRRPLRLAPPPAQEN
jgi:hypothetical protein